MAQQIIQQPEMKIPLIKKIQDWIVVIRSVWFIIALLLLGAFAFICVEQGQDMLFAVIDDFRWGAFWLTNLALGMWAMQTGFGSRLLIMFSDISFYEQLPEEEGEEKQRKQADIDARVKHRKKIATRLPRILFTIPFFIMSIGYIRAFFSYQGGDAMAFIFMLVMIAVTCFTLYRLVYWFVEKQMEKRLNEEEKRKIHALYQPRYLNELGITQYLLYVAVGIAVAIIIVYSLLPVRALQSLGSVHIITMSFGCWIAVLYFIDYLDKRISFVFKFILIGIMLLVSYINYDHPVRIHAGNNFEAPKQNIANYFDKWYAAGFSEKDSAVPVFFISAEGGACRSGYWTSKVLAELQDNMPGFADHLFSYSSVSGGSLGVNAFNAIHNWKTAAGSKKGYSDAVDAFYQKDFLAPITGRLVFAESFNLFSTTMTEMFDRASSLEISWEQSFAQLDSMDRLAHFFNKETSGGPAVFINSTEIETGRRALLSNVLVDTASFNDAVNLQQELNGNINYSTAILFSARFPYFSPAASIQHGEDRKSRRHYVDGGYFENMGNITTMEIINAVKNRSVHGKNIKPYVILITNDEEPIVKPVVFCNEALEPLDAFMKVRGGHTHASLSAISRFIKTKNINGEIIQFNMGLNGKTVPMNWYISDNAKRCIKDLFSKDKGYKQSFEKVAVVLKGN